MIRAVLDANVFVSGILNPRGTPGTILAAWRAEQFSLLISEAILREIGRVLRYPKIVRRHRWPEKRIQAFQEDLTHLAILTPGALELEVIKDDPEDNRYLECAVKGQAEYIVSGDDHLVTLGEYQGIRILPPIAFLQILRERPQAQV